jgi:hypothetical protein
MLKRLKGRLAPPAPPAKPTPPTVEQRLDVLSKELIVAGAQVLQESYQWPEDRAREWAMMTLARAQLNRRTAMGTKSDPSTTSS